MMAAGLNKKLAQPMGILKRKSTSSTGHNQSVAATLMAGGQENVNSQQFNNDQMPLFRSNQGGMFSTNESTMIAYNNNFNEGFHRSKSPLIDQTITSTLFGGGPSINSLSQSAFETANASKPAGTISLAEEYKQRQREMDERLKREIDQNKVGAVMPVMRAQSAGAPLQPINPNSFANNQMSAAQTVTTDKHPLPFEQKPSKFVRSQRSIALRIKESYEQQVSVLEQEKLVLIQKLKDAWVELDKLNQEKGELNNRLISVFKFNRDMERHTLHGDDLLGVVDDGLKEELRQEKQQGICMREQIRMLENERMRTTQALSNCEGDKDNFTEMRQEMIQLLEQRERDWETLNQEALETRQRIEAYTREVDELRELCRQMQMLIEENNHELHCSVDGRLSLVEQLQIQERRYQQTVDFRNRERAEVKFCHNRTVRLLGATFLFEKVAKIANVQRSKVLTILKKESFQKQSTISGLQQLRRLFKMNRRRRVKRALYTWYYNGLKPLRNLKQSMAVEKNFMKDQPLHVAYHRWRSAFLRVVQREHIKLATANRIVTIKTHQNAVAAKEFLHKWRSTVNLRYNEWRKIETLRKMLVRSDRDKLRNRFYRWKAISLELENTIQMQVLYKRYLYRTFITSVFSGWRRVALDWKYQRRALLNKSWKILTINVQKSKQYRNQKITIYREHRNRIFKNLLKACFYGWRHYKQVEKLNKITHGLFNVELPRKQGVIEDIEQIKISHKVHLLEKAFSNLTSIKKKHIYSYLNKWKQVVDDYHERVNTELKMKAIHRYKWILVQAMQRWLNHRNKSHHNDQRKVIAQWNISNRAVAEDIKNENFIIDEKKLYIKTQSAKSMKTLVMEAFMRQLRYNFMQWRDQVQTINKKEKALEKLLHGFGLRYTRLNFHIYQKQVQQLKNEELDIKRGNEYRLKLKEILMLRTFKRLLRFVQNSHAQKHRISLILKRLDSANKQGALKHWISYLQLRREEALEHIQSQKVETLATLQSHIGELSDQVTQQTENIEQLIRTYEHSCKKVVIRNMNRYVHMSTQYCFAKWCEAINRQQRARRVIMDAFAHSRRSQLSYCFMNWQKSCSEEVVQQKALRNIEVEESIIVTLKNENSLAIKQHEIIVEDLTGKLTRLGKENNMLEAKHSSCLRTIVDRVDNCHSMFKMRFLITQWRQYTEKKKKCSRNLIKSLQKSLFNAGFSEIKHFSQERERAMKKERKLNKFFQTVTSYKQRTVLTQWLSLCQTRVDTISGATHQETTLLVKVQNKLIERVHNRIENQIGEHRRYVNLFDCFIGWKVQSRFLKAVRVKTEMHNQWQMQRDREQAVKKWQMRVKKTKLYRQRRDTIMKKYALKLANTAWKAWLLNNSLHKSFCQSLSNLTNKVDVVYERRAFQQIMTFAKVNHTCKLFSKVKACQGLITTFSSAFDHKMRSIFFSIRDRAIEKHQQQNALRSITKYLVGHKLRDYLLQWRQEAHLRTVKQFNTLEGPVAVDLHKERTNLLMLKNLCLDEGISIFKVAKIIQQNRLNSRQGYSRVISRLLCYGDQEQRVLPVAFDRWRLWLKFRKSFKYYLTYTNNFINPRKQTLASVFNKWKRMELEMKGQLKVKKKSDLERVCVRINGKMGDMGQQYDDNTDLIEDLHSQRDLLLARYVGSQKLALAAVKSQNTHTKQKAVSRWLSQNQRAEKADFEHILKLNLMRIATLKEKIRQMELSNQNMADQNNDLRQGALDGIEMAKSMDELTREREMLTIDIADKAFIVRKLLEDNANLNQQLTHAQEQAKSLIQLTHHRFMSDNHPLRYNR